MNFFHLFFFTVYFLLSTGISCLEANNEKILSSEDHCVAYATPEKILFFPEYIVIGKSCKIIAKTENNDNQSRFIVDIPLESFNSGVSARDDDVMEILKADKFPNVSFETTWLSKEKIKNILSNGYGNINGLLKISGIEYSISIDIIVSRKGENYSFRGLLVTNYKFFNLIPPKLGILAEVLNSIKIIVNLQSNQIIGFEKVINLES